MFYQKYGKSLVVFLLALSPLATQAGDIEFNGFGSAYYAQALNANLLPPAFSDTHSNFTSFSNLGLNLGSQITDRFSAAAQLVAFGPTSTASWSLIANWAFLVYRPTSTTMIKAGRQLIPVYMASEYVAVGYLQPFRRIPSTLFTVVPYSGFDGVSATQELVDLGGVGKLSLSAFVGGPNISGSAPPGVPPPSVSDALGVTLALDGDGYRVQVHADRASILLSLPGGPPPAPNLQLNAHPLTFTGGYRFDKFGIVSWGELGYMQAPEGTAVPFPFGNNDPFLKRVLGGYVLVGYRIGPFLPRYTYGSQDVQSGLADGLLTTHTFGLNIQLFQQAIVKLEYELNVVPDPTVAGGRNSIQVTRAAGATDTTGSAFYGGVDFIF